MSLKILKSVRQYPRAYLVLLAVSLVDQLGKWLLFPFFALYATERFGISMTQTGLVLAAFFVAGMVGRIVAGALSDLFGRRTLILAGLLISAATSLAMGLAADSQIFLIMVAIAGLTSNIGGPAQDAMIADILPEYQRQQGYSGYRVVYNLATVIGPLLGGLLAVHSYLALFIFDAVSSVLAAGVARYALPETAPQAVEGQDRLRLTEGLRGYARIARDRQFVAFWVFSVLMILGYLQIYSILSVFLRDVHGLGPNWFSYLVSLNAILVVLFQLGLTARLKRYPPKLMMALGAGLMGLGLPLFALGSQFALFALAMGIITLGEMLVVPVAQTVVANLAPETMRGRYAAAYGLAWSIANAVGPVLAGLVLDLISPYWVWYLAGAVALIAAVGYFALHLKDAPAPAQPAAA